MKNGSMYDEWVDPMVMKTVERIYFVWVMSNGKAWPEKRYGIHIDGHGKEGTVAYSRLLDETEIELSLNALAYKYPYERKEENV